MLRTSGNVDDVTFAHNRPVEEDHARTRLHVEKSIRMTEDRDKWRKDRERLKNGTERVERCVSGSRASCCLCSWLSLRCQ